MQRLEMRERMITYCDYCNKELNGTYHILEYKDGSVIHLCSVVKDIFPYKF